MNEELKNDEQSLDELVSNLGQEKDGVVDYKQLGLLRKAMKPFFDDLVSVLKNSIDKEVRVSNLSEINKIQAVVENPNFNVNVPLHDTELKLLRFIIDEVKKIKDTKISDNNQTNTSVAEISKSIQELNNNLVKRQKDFIDSVLKRDDVMVLIDKINKTGKFEDGDLEKITQYYSKNPDFYINVRLTDGKSWYKAINEMISGGGGGKSVSFAGPDGKPTYAMLDSSGRLRAVIENMSITLSGSEIQIGAVEMKDSLTDLRVNISLDQTKNAMFVQSESMAKETTVSGIAQTTQQVATQIPLVARETTVSGIATTNQQVVRYLRGLSGVGNDGSALTVGLTVIQVPPVGSVPTDDYVLLMTQKSTDTGSIFYGFTNSVTIEGGANPGQGLGKLKVNLRAGNVMWVIASVATQTLHWSTKII